MRCVFWGATRFLGARRGTPRRYKGRRAIPLPGMNGALPLRRGSGGECWSLAIARNGIPAMPDCRGGVFAVFAKIPPPILSNHMCVSCPPIPISHVCIPCPPIPSAILPIMPAHPASHVCVSCAPILPTMGACRTRPFLSPMCACDARPFLSPMCAYHARPSCLPWARTKANPSALRLRRSFHAIMNFPFFLLTSRDVFSAFEGGEDARHALLCGAIRVNLGLGF